MPAHSLQADISPFMKRGLGQFREHHTLDGHEMAKLLKVTPSASGNVLFNLRSYGLLEERIVPTFAAHRRTYDNARQNVWIRSTHHKVYSLTKAGYEYLGTGVLPSR